VVRTAHQTEFGKVSDRLQLWPPETDFEHGIRRFGYFLTEITLLLVLCIFAANVLLQRPVLDSLLFSLALAVGLTPQLLPAIISVNLAHGVKLMAAEDVIVRRLSSIENFGSMDVLCADKTGTLTEGVIHLHAAEDATGVSSEKVLQYAYLNACFESCFANPIDEAIRTSRHSDVTHCRKLDEVPYDFIRKRLSVLVAMDNHHVLITKGAVDNVLAVCSAVETAQGAVETLDSLRVSIQNRFSARYATRSRLRDRLPNQTPVGRQFSEQYSSAHSFSDCIDIGVILTPRPSSLQCHEIGLFQFPHRCESLQLDAYEISPLKWMPSQISL
jgi:P-type Mg2+ transporter